MTTAIDLDGLTKHYGDVRSVENLSLRVDSGEIYGFLGHNGAGKTTTLRMLLGLTSPTRGRARVLGHDVATESLAIRRKCGFLPASYALPADMTARQFLRYVGAMFGLDSQTIRTRTDRLIERFGLTDAAERRLGSFSTGMTQKVGLAQALINEPQLLLLDEPTSGLDPLGRHELLTLLRELSQREGVTVFFSSHILSDIEALCRRVGILHCGRMLACGELAALELEHGVDSADDLYLALARKAA